jgi:transcriptional/translational regulatory protein YebC/TACO1
MSGHSKWSTIKRKKGANDAARGKVFTKLAREIQVAARNGADPTTNFALRLAVEKARAENMPKDNIEGYGPNGVAMLVDCLTDNRNRTIGDLRRIFTRGNGSLGEPNSVAWQFTSRGYLVYNLVDDDGAPTGLDGEEIFMAALEAGADDVVVSDDVVEVYTDRELFAEVTRAMTEAGYEPASADLTMLPNQSVTLDAEGGTAVLRLVEQLDELDDVSNVYHNLELTDDVVAAFA